MGGGLYENFSVERCVRRHTMRVTGCVVRGGTAIERATGRFQVDGDAIRVIMAG